MRWFDFGPYVLPYVIGCPEPTLEQHAKLAAIEFFRRTLSWRAVLDAVSTDGSAVVELEIPLQSQMVKIKSVSVDGRAFALVETAHGMELSLASPGSEFVFTHDNLTLSVYPLQKSGTQVVVECALAPILTSTSIADAVALAHVQDIAHGAIASIARIPGQVFTDPNNSQAQQMLFERRIATVAAKHSRGLMAAKMRSRATFL